MDVSKKKRSSPRKLFDEDGTNYENSKRIHLSDETNSKMLNSENNEISNEIAADDESTHGNISEKSSNVEDFIGFTSFKELKAYDKSIELVAKVSGFSGPAEVGSNRNRLYKVDLTNDRGEKLQLAAWNNDIKRIAPFIETNAILHIESVYCKPITKPKFNKGTETYELVVQSNTIVTVLGHDEIESNGVQHECPVPLVRIRDLLVCGHQVIRTTGFVKTNFGLIKTLDGMNECVCGSITDKHIKVEVRIHNTEESDIPFKKGDYISLKGSIQANANPIYILVRRSSDISKESDEKLSFVRLIKITDSLGANSHNMRYDSDE